MNSWINENGSAGPISWLSRFQSNTTIRSWYILYTKELTQSQVKNTLQIFNSPLKIQNLFSTMTVRKENWEKRERNYLEKLFVLLHLQFPFTFLLFKYSPSSSTSTPMHLHYYIFLFAAANALVCIKSLVYLAVLYYTKLYNNVIILLFYSYRRETI